jgi:hypothetical protein
MSMKNILTVLTLICIALACSKDRLSPLPEGDQYSPDLKPTDLVAYPQMPASMKKQEEKVTISSEKDLPFITKNGNQIIIRPNHFNALPNGKQVTYPFQLVVTELLSIKDIILHEKQTVSNGRLLTTDGQILIEAFKDGEQLTIAMYASPHILMQGMKKPKTDPQMRIFLGEEIKSGFNWLPDLSECERPGSECGSIWGEKGFYSMFPSRIGWINIDKFAGYDKTTFVKFGSEIDLKFIRTFIYFPEINSVLQVQYDKEFQVPIGFKARIISFALSDDEKMYAFYKDIVIQPDHEVKIVLFQTTKEEVIKELDKL